MSNVVVSNRTILNQKLPSIDKSKVNLPFNVSKEQIKKLISLLSKAKIEFLVDIDKLEISKLSCNEFEIGAPRIIDNSKFTLAKSYVVTMKKTYIDKVMPFYQKVVGERKPERPIFDIKEETNLQQALKEATLELDLSALNLDAPQQEHSENKTNVVLANSQVGQPEIKVDNSIMGTSSINQVPQQENPITDQISTINPQPISIQETPVVNQQVQMQQPAMVNMPQSTDSSINIEQPKVKVKKLRGNILIIPIIVIWLGLVLFGSIKLVTSILT